jgi:RNA-binding protein
LKLKTGLVALNQNLENVGTIFDIFGPIETPYISVKPSIRNPSNYVGQLLYFEENTEKRR